MRWPPDWLRSIFPRLYTGFVLLLVVSLPFSRFGLSVAQFSILGFWFLEGRLIEKAKELWNNKAAIVLISLYLLHLAGLAYTSDIQYGLKDVRVKLPLLFLPVAFVTSDYLRTVSVRLVLRVYILAVVVATIISAAWAFYSGVTDFRAFSPFISHIRLSLNVVMAIFFMMLSLPNGELNFRKLSWWKIPVILWMVLFLVMIQSASGLTILIALIALQVLVIARKSGVTVTGVIAAVGAVLVVVVPVWWIVTEWNRYSQPPEVDFSRLPDKTANGNYYRHDTIRFGVENGAWVGLYICEPELEKEWNKRSDLPFTGRDYKGQPLEATLIRYLSSLGLPKDSSGVAALSDKEIYFIENGIANEVYTRRFSVKARLYKIFLEYDALLHHKNPGGHSVLQRLVYWKASLNIIGRHMLTGVGTGDLPDAFREYYQTYRPEIPEAFRHRSHNQYLAIAVAFGIPGVLIFLFTLIYPGIATRRFRNGYYLVFWVVLTLSMLVEDTLETQMGVTLYAFFNSWLLFGWSNDEQHT
ncbi:MAG: hypothetical protein Kow00127_04700 [Bacteroidales bacterium]